MKTSSEVDADGGAVGGAVDGAAPRDEFGSPPSSVDVVALLPRERAGPAVAAAESDVDGDRKSASSLTRRKSIVPVVSDVWRDGAGVLAEVAGALALNTPETPVHDEEEPWGISSKLDGWCGNEKF